MLLRVDNESLAEDLVAHFNRSNFVAGSAGGGMVLVSRPGASEVVESQEIALHLRIWEASHPGETVAIVPT